MAFAYQFIDGGEPHFLDYLIIGNGKLDQNGVPLTPTAFSDNGDSDKLIVTDDDEYRAVALLWGGNYSRIRPHKTGKMVCCH